MTPEKAKPTEMVDEHGKPTLWFTAKETAEIAKAYARALNGATESELPYPSVMESIAKAKKMRDAWENKFEEWGK